MTEREPNEEPLPIHERPIAEVASFLKENLGWQLTAYALRETDTAVIDWFADGTEKPASILQSRMRTLAEICATVLEKDSPETLRALMIGQSPELDNHAPIELIHEGRGTRVLDVAAQLAG